MLRTAQAETPLVNVDRNVEIEGLAGSWTCRPRAGWSGTSRTPWNKWTGTSTRAC
jgi:hypothetical protein